MIRRGPITAALAGLVLAALLLLSGFPRVQLVRGARAEVQEDLKASFSSIRRVSDLPAPLVAALRDEGKVPLPMADPGEPYNQSCITGGSMPMSRLILAGCSARRCFVEYETDGYGHSVELLGFSAGPNPRLLWSEYIATGGESLKSLRAMLGQHWSLVTGQVPSVGPSSSRW